MRVELEWDFRFFRVIRIISTLLLKPGSSILPDRKRGARRKEVAHR
jgi:hypothetical protein